MKKILVIPLLFIAVVLSAAPIGENRAKEIALSFFAKSATRSAAPAVELAWAGDDIAAVKGKFNASATNLGASLLYIYNRTDAKGYVVVAGDDTVRPIIAFSHENSIDVTNLPAGARAMLAAWCKQVAASRAGQRAATRTSTTDDGVGQVVVKYNTAQWNQGTPFNNYAPVYDGCTSVTGCVATALSIICKYNEWPNQGVGTTPSYSYADDNGVTRTIEANTLGHTYDYSLMRSDNYTGGYTEAEGHAVATLMKDIGRAVKMHYHYNGSGAQSENAFAGMIRHFKYSKSARILYGESYESGEWFDIIAANISKCGPTYYAATDGEGGHAFVLDGYTTGRYISVNYGWGGSANGYYLMPDMIYIYASSIFVDFVPDRDGTSQSVDQLAYFALSNGTSLVYTGLTPSGDINTQSTSRVSYGGVMNVGVEDFNGDLRIAHCDKNGNVKSVPVKEFSASITAGNFIYDSKQVTFDAGVTIATGDKLVMQYRGANSTEWQTVMRADNTCAQEILLKPTPEEIAAAIAFEYKMESSRYGYQIHLSTLGNRSAMYLPFTVTSSAGDVVANKTISMVSSTKVATYNLSGEYTVKVTCNDVPYEFKVVF